MTVLELVGPVPPYLIHHEVGHLFIGALLGYTRCAAISFAPGNPAELARASFLHTQGNTEAGVIRALAGMVVQARLSEDSISQPLRGITQNRQLFKSPEILDPDSELRRSLTHHGFSGDLENRHGALTLAKNKMGDSEDKLLAFLSGMESELHEMLSAYVLKQIQVISTDIDHWMNRTNLDECNLAPPYHYNDAKAALAVANLA
jgi:hypothetical protein